MVTDTTNATEDRAAFAAGLRAVADWLDANPEVALPFPRLAIYSSKYGGGSALEEGAAFARVPGRCEKSTTDAMGVDGHFTLTRQFGPIALIWKAARSSVCEKRTVTKAVEEWVCPDSLLREADEQVRP